MKYRIYFVLYMMWIAFQGIIAAPIAEWYKCTFFENCAKGKDFIAIIIFLIIVGIVQTIVLVIMMWQAITGKPYSQIKWG